jgi:tetratricopeptide (TPR) repeat protein
MLAQALDAQGRLDEALGFTEAAEEVTAPNDLVGQVKWRGARAKILARLGRHEQAEALAREAAGLARQTPSFLMLRGDVLMDLADVLLLGGGPAEAAERAREALRLYEQKGSVVSAGRASAFLAELAGAAAST